MIEIKHLRKEYENATPLKDVNTIINSGDVISVIGPSGTGKSTLLRAINLLDPPTSGEIIIDGKNIMKNEITPEDVRKRVGMVFQGFYLYPHLNVIENVMVPQMDILKRSKQEAYDKAEVLLKQVGLFDKMFNYPDSLSGGQKQRIAIARTLAMDTEIILFDEPTSALDPNMVDEVQYVIKELAKQGKTMMIVTHEMRFAKEVANRVFFMCDGLIYEDGTPEQIFDHPQKEKTIEFINRINKKEIIVDSKFFDFPAAVRDINEFGYKNRIDDNELINVQLVFEEIIMSLLLPMMPDKFKIKAVLSKSDVTGTMTLTILYNLSSNPLENSNKNNISLDIINKKTLSISIEECYEEDFNKKMLITF